MLLLLPLLALLLLLAAADAGVDVSAVAVVLCVAAAGVVVAVVLAVVVSLCCYVGVPLCFGALLLCCRVAVFCGSCFAVPAHVLPRMYCRVLARPRAPPWADRLQEQYK